MAAIRSALILVVLAALLASVWSVARAQNPAPESAALPTTGTMRERAFFSTSRHPAIGYSERASEDAVGVLARKVAAGEVRLQFDRNSGYLLSILDALGVPKESQSLVFSKTSLQSDAINPRNPRAIFYSDDAAVAFIRNAPQLELSALDPALGVVFYTVAQDAAERPQIKRNDSCLTCHQTRNSLGVPGMLTLSVGARIGGETVREFADFVTDHRTSFDDRWGGWFITGNTGQANHLGNMMLATEGMSGRPQSPSRPWSTLTGWYRPGADISPYSDVAAVMVLEHQTGMTNLLTRFGWEARVALQRMAVDPSTKATAEQLIAANARELVDYLLFVDEPALPGPFESTSGFEAKFASKGPHDKQGRSLRQLDLGKRGNRMMRYPCSYMIYSRAFDSLPDAARDAVYRRIWTILSGGDTHPRYARLSLSDRAAITEIIEETKPDSRAYFRASR